MTLDERSCEFVCIVKEKKGDCDSEFTGYRKKEQARHLIERENGCAKSVRYLHNFIHLQDVRLYMWTNFGLQEALVVGN